MGDYGRKRDGQSQTIENILEGNTLIPMETDVYTTVVLDVICV